MNKSIASTQGQKISDTRSKNQVSLIFFVSQSRLTDAVSVIFGELLSYEHPSKEHFLFERETSRLVYAENIPRFAFTMRKLGLRNSFVMVGSFFIA